MANGKLSARQVRNGQVRTLWTPRPLPRSETWSLLLKRRPGKLVVVADGVLVGQAQGCAASGGKLGSQVSGDARLKDLRVQEVEPVYFTDDFMRAEKEIGAWETVSGDWRTKSIDSVNADAARSANPFSYGAVADGKAIAVTGYWFWDSYLYRVSVKPEAPGAVGLVVFFQDPQNYVAFRWWSNDSPHSPRARELVYVRDGVERIASASGSGYQLGQWYRLTIKATDTKLQGFIDQEPAFVAESPPFCGGKIGLYAERCAAVSFDDVLCLHWENPADDPSPRLDAPRITPQFAQEGTMQAWANPDYDWRKGEDDWWWHRGEFWGDASLAADLPNPEGVAATAALTIHAERGKPNSGYTLRTESSPDGSALSYALTRQGQLLGKGKMDVSDWPVSVEVWRHDRALLVSIAGERVLRVADANPLSGTASALRTTGRRIPTQQVYATGTHYLDDTFASAPVNWWQGKGKWHVTSRWQCDPKWSWMAGWQSAAPTLWTKRTFGGDFLVEAYVCNKMEQQGPAAYTHPGDLNLTVCGDGRDLGSGYSFLYAGWNNTASGLFRRGEECAPRNASAFFANASNLNPAFHTNWFNVRVERRGNRLRHWMGDELISEYADPSPLPFGRLALWTVGNGTLTNGLVVARARIWYERDAPAAPFPAPRVRGPEGDPWKDRLDPVPADAHSVKHNFETGTQGWSGYNRPEGALVSLDSTTAASGSQSLRLENLGSGGDFTAWAGAGPFDATKLGKLRFAYKVPQDVKVNLYVQVGGQYYALEFTGGPQPSGTCQTLGKIASVRVDNQWHTVEFDLGKALQQALPGRNSLLVERVCFSVPRETYYRAGIGGNGWGAKWWVDDFELAV